MSQPFEGAGVRGRGKPGKPVGSFKPGASGLGRGGGNGSPTRGKRSSGDAYYSKVHRILKILALIQAQRGWTAARLANECGVAERTIYRDFQTLEGAGIPYHFDSELKCYQVNRSFFMKPVELALDEALAIIALGEHIGGQEQVPFTRPAVRAVAKIRGQLPRALRSELDELDGRMAIRLAASMSPEGVGDVYEKICRAIAEKRVVTCIYEALSGSAAEPFDFMPYTLFFSQRAWYAVGHHAGRNEVRCLKLNRFTSVQPTERRYKVPADFSMGKHLGNAWRMIRGDKSYDVELHFDASFAETISDTHWHDTQELDWHDDGSLTFRCKVDGLDEIVWWVLSMGPHCRVVAPAELAQRVAGLAQGVVKLYSRKPRGRR